MKVISRGTQRITCKQCGSVLEYEWSDIKEWNNSYYIVCPVCGKSLEVEDKIENPYSDLRGYQIGTDTTRPYTLTPGYPYETFSRDGVYASNSVSVCTSDAISALSTSVKEGAAAYSALAEACSTTASKEDDLCALTAKN